MKRLLAGLCGLRFVRGRLPFCCSVSRPLHLRAEHPQRLAADRLRRRSRWVSSLRAWVLGRVRILAALLALMRTARRWQLRLAQGIEPGAPISARQLQEISPP